MALSRVGLLLVSILSTLEVGMRNLNLFYAAFAEDGSGVVFFAVGDNPIRWRIETNAAAQVTYFKMWNGTVYVHSQQSLLEVINPDGQRHWADVFDFVASARIWANGYRTGNADGREYILSLNS